ncbi:hypothetical protein T10_2472 [Trichinella papuae]|uniref:Uncharacterized protein n=1 Tax=Trichinella papuae TaxID=268474 RepID=A0A0V1MV38_9BILA|nr:hypothetical protein T10_2472 [Trichinella papuae]
MVSTLTIWSCELNSSASRYRLVVENWTFGWRWSHVSQITETEDSVVQWRPTRLETISLPTTAANFEAAMQILKGLFGNPKATMEKRFNDQIEVRSRGLQALGRDPNELLSFRRAEVDIRNTWFKFQQQEQKKAGHLSDKQHGDVRRQTNSPLISSAA